MKIYAMTDVGRKREVNQDFVYVTDKPVGPFPNLLVVADGMGGHKAGDFASKYTVKVLHEELENTKLDKPEEILNTIIHTANHELIKAAHSDVKLEGMEMCIRDRDRRERNNSYEGAGTGGFCFCTRL